MEQESAIRKLLDDQGKFHAQLLVLRSKVTSPPVLSKRHRKYGADYKPGSSRIQGDDFKTVSSGAGQPQIMGDGGGRGER